jgi:hypothetical protein
MQISIIIIGSVFYLSLLIGSIVRFRRERSATSIMQTAGTVLPLVPCAFIPFFGINRTILVIYGLAWLPMGFGYLIEGIVQSKQYIKLTNQPISNQSVDEMT